MVDAKLTIARIAVHHIDLFGRGVEVIGSSAKAGHRLAQAAGTDRGIGGRIGARGPRNPKSEPGQVLQGPTEGRGRDCPDQEPGQLAMMRLEHVPGAGGFRPAGLDTRECTAGRQFPRGSAPGTSDRPSREISLPASAVPPDFDG